MKTKEDFTRGVSVPGVGRWDLPRLLTGVIRGVSLLRRRNDPHLPTIRTDEARRASTQKTLVVFQMPEASAAYADDFRADAAVLLRAECLVGVSAVPRRERVVSGARMDLPRSVDAVDPVDSNSRRLTTRAKTSSCIFIWCRQTGSTRHERTQGPRSAENRTARREARRHRSHQRHES